MLARFRKAPSLKEKQKITREMLQLEQKGVPVERYPGGGDLIFYRDHVNQTNKLGARLEALLFLKDLDPIQIRHIERAAA